MKTQFQDHQPPRTSAVFALAGLVLCAALACKGGEQNPTEAEGPAKPGSCQEGGKEGSTCSDYTAEGAKQGKDYCNKTGGGKNVWSDSPCPKENRIGTCERKRGQTQHYYSTGEDALPADQAEEMCTTLSEGKWKAAN